MTSKDKRRYSDRKDYLISAVQRRRRELKIKAVEYKGGKCQTCGYNRCLGALEFHHLDPKTKKFGISAKGITRKWESVKKELDKCIMLCANCHREVYEGILKIPKVIK